MSRKKVLLVNANLSESPYAVPPVGLCLVAESISEYYDVKVHDGAFGGVATLYALIEQFKPDYIGISIRNIDDYSADQRSKDMGINYFIPAINELFVKPIKLVFSGPLILGGAGYSLFPYELLELFGADYGITGEGEWVFRDLLLALDNGNKQPSVAGCIYKGAAGADHAELHGSQPGRMRANIDKWINYSPYKQKSAYPIQTKRGCPHRCVYCSYSLIEGKQYRLRNAPAVVDEIEDVASRIDTSFEIVDSVFNDPPGHAEKICEEIIRRNCKVRLRTMGVNPDNVTDSLVTLMREAGFRQIDCTPDTASVPMIAHYRKNFTYRQLVLAAEIFKKHDMPVMWFFILGGPGESVATLHETFDFVEQYIGDLDLVSFSEGMRIYPGTALYDVALREGMIKEGESLLQPSYYLSSEVADGVLKSVVAERKKNHLNWISISESRPEPQLLQKTLAYRAESRTDEPMFRSLLKVKWQSAGRDYINCQNR